MPDLYIIAGPNGAGKTTTALRVFPRLGVTAFVNADIIAQGLSPLNVELAARDAGRIMLSEMERHLAAGDDFALETTLASRTLAPFVRRCKENGYRFILIYVWLESSDLAVNRVAKRVRAGGHNIPEDVIRRRYERG
ncbi:MAG TPA: AAA family ATPase, partial [Abditibacterium sp.]